MEALLKKSCPHCTASSIRTYTVNVRALAKEAGLEKPPAHAKWLTQKLLNKIKAKPVNQYKRLAIAGVKALGAYETKDKKWHDAMNDATRRSARSAKRKIGPMGGTRRYASSPRRCTPRYSTSRTRNRVA